MYAVRVCFGIHMNRKKERIKQRNKVALRTYLFRSKGVKVVCTSCMFVKCECRFYTNKHKDNDETVERKEINTGEQKQERPKEKQQEHESIP